jgi:hypothetical protein
MWEFHLFGGQSMFDSAGLAPRSLSGQGIRFDSEISLDDDTFPGIRFGYNWSKQVEAEVSYDKNQTHGTYMHDFDDGNTVEHLEGGVSYSVACYQLGLVLHPWGNVKTRFQPFFTVGGGYMDASIDPSDATLASLADSNAAQSLGADIDQGDSSWIVSYGLGAKYYFSNTVGLRAEFRGKASDIFDDRRNDFEWTLGVSIFVPGLGF